MFFCLFVLFLSSVYDDLVTRGVIVPAKEVPPPTVPMDYSWARVSTPESQNCKMNIWSCMQAIKS